MSLEKIKDSILSNAKKEAERIIKDAKSRLQEKTEEERVKIEEYFEKKFIILSRKFEDIKNRKLTELRIKYKMELLSIKNSTIETVFSSAINKFISDDKYWQTMERWLKNINEPCVVSMNPHDSKRFNQEFIDKMATQDKITLNKKNIDIRGGFIVKTDRYEIDHSLDTLLDNLKFELAPMIANKLFSD